MATLAENAAAVKQAQVAIDAAIVAKGGTTEGGLTNAAAAIAALPSGGDLTPIEGAVETMTGEDHTGDTAEELAQAIREITRKPNRRLITPPPQSTFVPTAGVTAFVVSIDGEGAHGYQFTVGGVTRLAGHSTVTIDWGDGNTTTTAETERITHTYAAVGFYKVEISDDCSAWRPHYMPISNVNYTGSNSRYPTGAWANVLSDGMPDGCWDVANKDKIVFALSWGAAITSASSTYYGCSGLTGAIPEWGAAITSASSTYYGCSGLTGAIPEWGAEITSASSTYYGCSGLTGAIPEWGAAITSASNTYNGCSGLTGAIPEWGAAITSAFNTYTGCSGLTGAIPEWGAAITNAQSTYYGCSGLTGAIPEWGAAITNAQSTYNGCSGLTGAIPEWGAAIINAQNTYQYCIGLTAVWGGATDATLMPAKITSHSNTVANTNDYLRGFFLTSWGGSRAS